MFKPMRPVSNKRISYRIPLLMIAALVVIAGIALIYERINLLVLRISDRSAQSDAGVHSSVCQWSRELG